MSERGRRLILVTGATGYVGGRLVPRLLLEGYRVRCMAREPERLSGRGWKGAEIVAGDALVPDSLKAALKGVTDAYYLIHSMSEGDQFEERDRIAAASVRHAAYVSGVERIIYLGGLARRQEALSPHLQSRIETGEVLRLGPVPVTEFRAAVIVGSGSLSFELIRYLTERLPIMVCPKWVNTMCQPIGIRNVLEYLVALLDEPRSAGQILEIGGADVLTYRKMMEIYAEERESTRRILNVPVLSTRLSSYWVNLITPIPSVIARPLIEGLKNEAICHDDMARRLFPLQILTYREAVELALDRIRSNTVETVWTGALSAAPRALPPPVSLHSVEGMIVEERSAVVKASAERAFGVVARIGGQHGYFCASWMWRMRGWLDWAVGGVGFRRGRRHPHELRVGDPLDFWRVEAWEKPRRIRLRAEMRVPGRAWLQFDVVPRDGKSVLLTQSAFFEPKGLWGLVYWYGLYSMHRVIFSGMIRHIHRTIEREEAQARGGKR